MTSLSDAYATWTLVRGRFDAELALVPDERLHARLFSGAMTPAEMAAHVAGVEVKFSSGVTGKALEGEDARIARAASDGVVNENPFPFAPEEMGRERLGEMLARGRAWAEPVLADPTPEIRAAQAVSVLGPVIDGTGVLARLAYHPAYHQAQLYLVRVAPDAAFSG